MAGGPFTGYKLEVEFTSGTWTDVSAYLDITQGGINFRWGRPTEFDDVAPGVSTVVLRNSDGRFTPDNPLSPYYPNVVEDKRIRFSITRSAVTYTRFTHYIQSWEPSFPTGDTINGLVTVSAADYLAWLARHVFHSRWVEEHNYIARQATTFVDQFALTAATATSGSTFDNIGVPAGGVPGTAKVITAATGAGQLTFTPDSQLALEGAADFAPDNNIGPGILCKPQLGTQNFEFMLAIPSDSVLPAGNLVVCDLWNGATKIASIQLFTFSSAISIGLYDGVGTLLVHLRAFNNDGVWRKIQLQSDGSLTTTGFYIDDGGIPSFGFDLRTVTAVTFGGGSPIVVGKQNAVPRMIIAGPAFMGTQRTVGGDFAKFGKTAKSDVVAAGYAFYLGSVVYSAVGASDYGRILGLVDITGRDALTVGQEIVRSMGAVLFADELGNTTIFTADLLRTTTVSATLGVESEIDAASAAVQLRRSIDGRPTRVTGSYLRGSITAIDTDTEALIGTSRSGQISTTCSTADQTLALAWVPINADGRLRFNSISVDLVTAAADLAGMLANQAMVPTRRVRLTGLPTAIFGASYVDLYMQGATERITHDSYVITFDTSSADAPPEAIWSDATYGRWSIDGTTVTAGTAVGGVGNGTLVLSAAVLTTSGAEYPIDFNWGGERVTVTAAPSGVSGSAPVVVSATYTAPAQGNMSASKPSGTASGDLLIAISWSDPDSGSASTLTAPSGWVQVGADGTGLSGYGRVWSKTATSSEPSSYTFGGSSASDNQVTIMRITGASGVIDVNPTWGSGSTATTSIVAPTITTTVAQTLMICGWHYVDQGVSNTWALPGSMTADSPLTPGAHWTSEIVAHEARASAAATGTRTATASVATTVTFGWMAVSLAVRPSASAQSLTTTSRGVAPTVARVHAPGESIDVWEAASWSP